MLELHQKMQPPVVSSVECGKYQWIKFEEEVSDLNDMVILENKLRNLSKRLDRILIRLKIKGILSLEDKVRFDTEIVEKLGAGVLLPGFGSEKFVD